MNKSKFLEIFLPNKVISKTTLQIVIVAQIAFFMLVWLNSPFEVLPKPNEVMTALSELWLKQGLGREVITSIGLNWQALLYTLIISLSLSYLTVIPFFRPLMLAVSKGRFLGLTGLSLIFTLMVGGGRPLKLSLLVFGMSVFFVTSMSSVVTDISRESFDHARTLRMSEFKIVWEVVILGTIDKAIEVFRQNAAIGWTMLTMVEGISRSEGGMGAMLLNQEKHFHLAEVFAIQIVILIIGIAQDYGIGIIKRIFCPYSLLSVERSE